MSFTFVDLFAGIGGFHAALEPNGGKCVYAIESDKKAAEVYERNWKLNPLGDITNDVSDKQIVVPKHDLLCAGFPCQPFSKSGSQLGMEDTRGTLYWSILKIIERRKPSVVLLENVRNLAGPRHIHEWKTIVSTLRDQGYLVSDTPTIFSPHLLPPHLGGRPQIRERVFIFAVRTSRRLARASASEPAIVSNAPINGWDPSLWNLATDLPLEPETPAKENGLSEQEVYWIDAWNDFVINIRKELPNQKIPGFPLWGDSWRLGHRTRQLREAPSWKADFLIKNSTFYKDHKKFIDVWSNKWNFYTDRFPPSRRKLEWQAQDTETLWDTILHFRPSGIRAKKATYVPALVAITQTSIIGSRRRRISIREGARLQGFPESFEFGSQTTSSSFRQLGNAVNVNVVEFILKKGIERYEYLLKETCPNLVAAFKQKTTS